MNKAAIAEINELCDLAFNLQSLIKLGNDKGQNGLLHQLRRNVLAEARNQSMALAVAAASLSQPSPPRVASPPPEPAAAAPGTTVKRGPGRPRKIDTSPAGAAEPTSS